MLKSRTLSCLTLIAGLSLLAPAQAAGESDWQQKLKSLFASDKQEEELLPPEKAFRLEAKASGPATIQATLTPAPGYYLYRERIQFDLNNKEEDAIKNVRLPKGDMKDDRTFGKMEIYRQPVTATIDLKPVAAGSELALKASYQGCHEQSGVCYPPQVATVPLTLP